MDIKDKRIIITGGASGLGLLLAERLAGAGAVVGILDINAEAIKRLPDGLCVFQRTCDVSNPEHVSECLNTFFIEQGRLDVLVNNAGIVRNSPLVQLTKHGDDSALLNEWDQVIKSNLSSAFYAGRIAARCMLARRTKGLILNVTSVCAAGNAGQGAYSAAKAGLAALTVVWAKELGPLGIRVAAVAPGYASTETTINAMNPERLEEVRSRTPLRRLADPLEIVEAMLYVIQADFFHGRTLEVDGGYRI